MNSYDLEQVLRRTAIPRGQITLLKELYERDDEFVSSSELIKRIRWGDQERFPGVLGAFGGRINETDEISDKPGIEAFFDRTKIDGEPHYQLRPEAREAIGNIEPLTNKFDRPMEKLLEPGTKIEYEDLNP